MSIVVATAPRTQVQGSFENSAAGRVGEAVLFFYTLPSHKSLWHHVPRSIHLGATDLNQLLSKIESKEAVVSIIGLGYVGLPLATAVEAAGFRTIGIDISQDRVEAVNREACWEDHEPGE